MKQQVQQTGCQCVLKLIPSGQEIPLDPEVAYVDLPGTTRTFHSSQLEASQTATNSRVDEQITSTSAQHESGPY